MKAGRSPTRMTPPPPRPHTCPAIRDTFRHPSVFSPSSIAWASPLQEPASPSLSTSPRLEKSSPLLEPSTLLFDHSSPGLEYSSSAEASLEEAPARTFARPLGSFSLPREADLDDLPEGGLSCEPFRFVTLDQNDDMLLTTFASPGKVEVSKFHLTP